MSKKISYDLNNIAGLLKPVIKIENLDIDIDKMSVLSSDKHCKDILITGKEPLINQQKLIKFLYSLNSEYNIIIKTSGGILPDSMIREKINQWLVNIYIGDQKIDYDWNCDALQYFIKNKDCYFEFMITEENISEINNFISNLMIPSKKVILYPDKDTEIQVLKLSKKFGYSVGYLQCRH